MQMYMIFLIGLGRLLWVLHLVTAAPQNFPFPGGCPMSGMYGNPFGANQPGSNPLNNNQMNTGFPGGNLGFGGFPGGGNNQMGGGSIPGGFPTGANANLGGFPGIGGQLANGAVTGNAGGSGSFLDTIIGLFTGAGNNNNGAATAPTDPNPFASLLSG